MKPPQQQHYVRSLNTTSSTSFLVLASEIDETHIVDVSLFLSSLGVLPACSHSVSSCLCDCLVNCIGRVPSAAIVVSIQLCWIISIHPSHNLNKITAEIVYTNCFEKEEMIWWANFCWLNRFMNLFNSNMLHNDGKYELVTYNLIEFVWKIAREIIYVVY